MTVVSRRNAESRYCLYTQQAVSWLRCSGAYTKMTWVTSPAHPTSPALELALTVERASCRSPRRMNNTEYRASPIRLIKIQ